MPDFVQIEDVYSREGGQVRVHSLIGGSDGEKAGKLASAIDIAEREAASLIGYVPPDDVALDNLSAASLYHFVQKNADRIPDEIEKAYLRATKWYALVRDGLASLESEQGAQTPTTATRVSATPSPHAHHWAPQGWGRLFPW